MKIRLNTGILLSFFFVLIGFISCNKTKKQFERIDKKHSNIDFVNNVFGEEELDIMENSFYYNGAGVMVADFDNDGLEDIYFSGNQVPSRLYKNKGNLEFEDITEASGLLNDSWSSGVTFADVNGDGYKDIYVCTASDKESNLFYENQGINENGIPTFKEKANSYGLTLKGVSAHAAFFDYDKDEDLDLVVAVNHQVMNYRNQIYKDTTVLISKKTQERLFRNNSDGTFSEVSKEAGLKWEGSSLGLAINDLNNDGWPDIYIANDFISNDLLYINNHDGTFTNKAKNYIRHGTFHGMGVDIADVNSDGLMDITVLDMLPQYDERKKRMQMPINYDLYEERIEVGYMPQFIRNTLQINQGANALGSQDFSEVGCLSGINATDWSWSPLWADYNNDAKRDLYITNGYPRDINDLDHMFGLDAHINLGTQESFTALKIKKQNATAPVFESNYFYKNKGDMKMEDASAEVGIDEPSISYGVAYADLDNDGDLELIVNNFRQDAFLYKNNTIENFKENGRANFIKIKLQNKEGKNLNGLGTTVKVYTNDEIQTYYHSYVRGYMSSMGDIIHFGIGNSKEIDSIQVLWPDNKQQVIKDITLNTTLNIRYDVAKNEIAKNNDVNFFFNEVTDSLNLNFSHKENKYTDFKNDPLLFKMYSKEGPGLAIGDVNGDGLDDIFMGGSTKNSSRLFKQEKGIFSQTVQSKDSIYEDMGALFFDIDNDTDLDLYVVSGGSEFGPESTYYQDRLYLNDGKGNFAKSENIPEIKSSGGPVKGADYDKDGDIDVFVGGKVKMGQYPTAPRSFLLNNDNGKLSDKTPEDLLNPGMVSDAIWSDFDNDGWIDLILVGEWMQISIYRNDKGSLKKYVAAGLEETSGWWNSIAGGDFDNDGDVDYLVGNLGTNTVFQASPEEPLRLYAGDYDKNNKIDPILTYYNINMDGVRKEMTFHNRDAMNDQIVGFKRRFRDYATYSTAPLEQVLTEKEINEATVLDMKYLTSSYIENLGNGTFSIKPLPWQCQVAPVNGMLIKDINKDGNLDVVMIGNLHSIEPIHGKLDASLGLYMIGTGEGKFIPVAADESGLYLKEDQKSIVNFDVNGNSMIAVGSNSGDFKALSYSIHTNIQSVKLQTLDSYAKITMKNGTKMKQEFYYGHSYLSQGARQLQITDLMKEVIIYDSFGKSRKIK